MGGRSPYNILELDEGASEEEIHAAYRRLARCLHPDQGGSVDAFRALHDAYVILSDEKRRQRFDEWLDRRAAERSGDSRGDGLVVRSNPATPRLHRSLWPRSPIGLMALRLLMISNIFVTAALGGIFFAYYSRPAAYAFSSASWIITIALMNAIRFTNPYR